MSITYYKAGSWNVVCDVCGFQYKSDELRKDWRGLMVCKNDYETRHPQDLLRTVEERNNVTYVRRDLDLFIELTVSGGAIDSFAINTKALG